MSRKRTSPRTPQSPSKGRRSPPQVSPMVLIICIDFNIFRDSLRVTSQQLLKTLQDNLPDMNLKEIEDEDERRLTDNEAGEEESDGEDVVPLDFRTALIEN